ncbi:hypothetical protein GNI_055430 [Gregarina niphandrodes]|uniref:Uncharacterized protein n=1 Tax=Gregarina niphandrodes TaxID=110365 RepID=A0A023B8V3_GRENI|nr:hypothetical protein GNI_055430 [Gregarina niphandrodes]EZG70508.1 hypothetical protein GNI_055430 [Gregarina niphandrodes]|eukprot:XP_011129928.1 hypothetical protein GNI_055430 [Gregarina niphandrodes]
MAQPPTRQALLQHVFEETVHVAGRLLPDTVEFLQQHDCRTVVILSANDTDSLLCVHVLQSCLSERLGLLVKLYVAACYADLLLASVRFRQESAVVIFINCCARIYIGDLFTDQEVHNEGENAQGDNRGRGMRDREMRNDQGYQNRRSGDKLLCLVDYHRPYDPEYVSNSLEQMAGRRKAASGLATNAVHIYLTEADYSRLKVQVYDKKEAGSFEKSTSDHDTNSISTIVDIMSLDLGEYVADDTSYAICYEALVETGILDSVETSSRPTQPDLFGYYAAMSLSFHVLQGHYTYRQYLSQINEIRRIMKCNLQEEINLPLLRFQSLKNTAEFSILHIGARLIYDNLNALRTELEINSVQSIRDTSCASIHRTLWEHKHCVEHTLCDSTRLSPVMVMVLAMLGRSAECGYNREESWENGECVWSIFIVPGVSYGELYFADGFDEDSSRGVE